MRTIAFLHIAAAAISCPSFLIAQDTALPRSTPEAQGVSSAAVRDFIETANRDVNSLHSFMLVRHGKVIAEAWWEPEAADKPHVLWSLSKSFTSTAVGLAVAEGRLRVDDPVLQFFPDDAPAEPSANLKAMRVRDLLTMTTGHQDEVNWRQAPHWAKAFLSHPVPHKPGTHFRYNTPATYMLSAIVQKVTGETVLEYLTPRLFEPLGIDKPQWDTSPQGISIGGYGLFLRTEDIAKFGQLYLQRGKWNEKQILPAEWVDQATSRQVSNGSNPNSDWDQGYGFQFWRCRHGAWRGDGKDGQFCIVLPEQDAVVAITAKTGDMQAELNLVWDKLFPAFNDNALPENPEEQARLKATIANLKVSKQAVPDATSRRESQSPVRLTTQEDHQQMMKQLGITKLRHGPSGNPNANNAANYDESLANPYPDWPDVLALNDGTPVTTSDVWWKLRRPELVEAFEREVYGRIPDSVPNVIWTVKETRDGMAGEVPVVEQHIVGTVDNSACPEIEIEISMSLTVAKNSKGRVPVLMMFGRTPFDPMPEWMRRFNRSRGSSGGEPASGPRPPSRTDELIAAGWGCVMINPSSIQADNGAGLTRGIIGLTNHGQPRKPDDWGSLRAWAWGASRGLDYLQTRPDVDAKLVGIEGVSRYGKAALVTMAFDERFAMVLVGSSGAGGATPHRRNFGEAVENLAGSGEYHWMAGNFLKYATDESTFGPMNACDLPVDSHELIALCAPRLTFISYGIPEKGDANWLDQRGSYMATVAAGNVFELLGAKSLGITEDFNTAAMPAVNHGLLDGQLAWRQHDGGHTDAPNIKYFIEWAMSRRP